MVRTAVPDNRWMGKRRHSTPNQKLPDRTYVEFGDREEAQSAVQKWMPVYADGVKRSTEGGAERHSDPGTGHVSESSKLATTTTRGKRLLRERLKLKLKKEAEREASKVQTKETTFQPSRSQLSERAFLSASSPSKSRSNSPMVTPKQESSTPRVMSLGRRRHTNLALQNLTKTSLKSRSPTSVASPPCPERLQHLHMASQPPPPPPPTIAQDCPPTAPTYMCRTSEMENDSQTMTSSLKPARQIQPETFVVAEQQQKSFLKSSKHSGSQNAQHPNPESDEERENHENARLQRTEEATASDLRQQYSMANMPIRTNRIRLHVYDLIAQETMMQLPWGCHFPIGQCFNAVNSGLHELGTGAYHVGIEINGVEYAYGANDHYGMTGVFTCIPMTSPGYQYRTTIDLGERALIRKVLPSRRGENPQPAERFVDGREVIREMAFEYMGMDYDLLRKNCVTFAHDACLRLGCQEGDVPDWFRNLCVAGAAAQDAANSTIEPISKVFSSCDMEGFTDMVLKDTGFEVISDGANGKTQEIVNTQYA